MPQWVVFYPPIDYRQINTILRSAAATIGRNPSGCLDTHHHHRKNQRTRHLHLSRLVNIAARWRQGRSRFESESGHEERTCHEQENVWGALLRLAAFLGRTPPHDREPYAACRHDGDGMRVPCPRVPTVCGTVEHSGGLLLLCPTDVRLPPTRVAIMLPAGVFLFLTFRPGRWSQAHGGRGREAFRRHGLHDHTRVRLPAWRSEKFNPFASLRRKSIKGFRTCQHRRRRTTK